MSVATATGLSRSPAEVGMECDECNPLECPFGPVGCGCSTGSIQPNNRRFADIDEQTHALRLDYADYKSAVR